MGRLFDRMGQADFHQSFNNDGGAILFLYGPHCYDTQVLRPYTYQINQNAVDKLVHGGSSMSNVLGKKEFATDPDIAGSIVPLGNGAELDMSSFENLWTFVLQIDVVSPWLGGSAVHSAVARRRIMYSGVCLDEPLNMFTMYNSQPTLNENCILRFTHATETVVDPGVGSMGMYQRTTVRSDVDIVDSTLNGQCNDKDLYIATPDRMLRASDNAEGITTEGLNVLSNQKKGVGIVSVLKSPLAHLRHLLMGLDQQIHLCESSQGNTVGSHMSDVQDVFDVDSFKDGVAGEWNQLSTALSESAGGVNPSDMIPLGYIKSQFPNITVVPQVFPDKWSPAVQEMGSLAQREINPKTIYSSMVSAAVSAIANNFGLSRIDFSYDSFVSAYNNNPEGSFEVHAADLLMPPRDPDAAREMLSHAMEMFRRQIVNDLVPTIKASNNGDFQMNVCWMCNAETYVDLNFYDWASLKDTGIYETTNRVANVNNTSVGTQEHFLNQGSNLEILVDNVYGRKLKGMFEQPHDPGTLIDTMAGEGGLRPY